MTESLEREIRTLRELYWSDRDPDGRVFATLADAYRRSGEIRQALELLEEGRERLPDFPSGHVVAARLYCDAGMMEEASLAARRALELDEENVEALRSLARSLEARGEVLEAARLRSRATDLGSTHGGQPPEAPAPDRVGSDAQEPDAEEAVGLDALAPDEEEAVGLDALAPAEEEPLALDALAPDEEEETVETAEEEPVFSLDDLAPAEEGETVEAAEEEPVFSLDELALAAEEAVGLDALAPDEEEPVALDALAPAEEEAVGLDALAPDEEEPVGLDALAPDEEGEKVEAAEEEPVLSLDALAPDEEEAVGLDELAPDEEEAVGLDALAPDGEDVADSPPPDATGGESTVPSGATGEGGPEEEPAAAPAPAASSAEDSEPGPTGDAEAEPSAHDPLPTRTLADLYARQGLTERALSVYRRLLLVTPGDVELQRRIEALSGGGEEPAEAGDRGAPGSGEGEAAEGPAIAELGLDREEQSSGSDLDTPFAWTEETEVPGAGQPERPISDYFSRMLAWGGEGSADAGEASR